LADASPLKKRQALTAFAPSAGILVQQLLRLAPLTFRKRAAAFHRLSVSSGAAAASHPPCCGVTLVNGYAQLLGRLN